MVPSASSVQTIKAPLSFWISGVRTPVDQGAAAPYKPAPSVFQGLYEPERDHLRSAMTFLRGRESPILLLKHRE